MSNIKCPNCGDASALTAIVDFGIDDDGEVVLNGDKLALCACCHIEFDIDGKVVLRFEDEEEPCSN